MTSQPSPSVFTDSQIQLALIRQEWRLCRGPVTSLAMLWVIGLWVLVLFNHPGALLVIGLLHVVFVSPAQAGRDVLDGTEEFSFTQPPGRSPLYLARLGLGLTFLLINGVIGGLAIAGNLPQVLWSLCFSSGLTEPFATDPAFIWYGFAVLAPTAAHAVTFALAANAGTRGGVGVSWLGGIAATAIVIGLGSLLENFLWGYSNGFLSLPALLTTTVLVPLAGHHAYLRKEATGGGGNLAGSGGGYFWIIAVILILLLLMLMSAWLFMAKGVSIDEESRLRRIDVETQPQQRSVLPQPVPPPPSELESN